MKLKKEDFCSSCLRIRQRMSNGSLGSSIEELLNCEGYKHPIAYTNINHMMLFYLEQNGGCPSCISLLRRATGQ
jgi:hypothetical protein